MSNPKPKPIDPSASSPPSATPPPEPITPIVKPDPLAKFKSKRSSAVVETLPAVLPHYPIPDARDYVRLHPDEDAYWSGELCFVNVPILGQKRDTLHLISEDLALEFLPPGKIQRFRLALASKPGNIIFFLAHVPSTHLDNEWNASNLRGCLAAKTAWVQAISQKAEGIDGYRIEPARHVDAFHDPRWPSQALNEMIVGAFSPDLMIDHEDHPGLLRLTGRRQTLG